MKTFCYAVGAIILGIAALEGVNLLIQIGMYIYNLYVLNLRPPVNTDGCSDIHNTFDFL